ELVLQQIQQSGLTLKIDKCHFCKTQLKYLVISFRKKELVLILINKMLYYRRFIKSYATIAEPLIALTRHSDLKSFQWSEACQNSFETLRQRLIGAPIISYPRLDQPFILQLDASDVGLS
ncbi:unnamed protein product, partial [Rotaria magnacalcarata]